MMAAILGFAQISLAGEEGGKVGSGGGVIVNPKSKLQGNVTVPFPGWDGMNSSSIGVFGEPGLQQSANYSVCQFKRLQSGKPQGLSLTKCMERKLNETIDVEPGSYVITYNGTFAIIDKLEDKSVAIQLRKIQIPQTSESIRAIVFKDLTDDTERRSTMIFDFLYNKDNKNTKFYTWMAEAKTDGKGIKSLNEFGRSMLSYANSGDLESYCKYHISFMGYRISFLSQADVHGRPEADLESLLTWSEYELWEVAESKTGSFVSVLPGTYGIRWENKETGQNKDQLGIRVN